MENRNKVHAPALNPVKSTKPNVPTSNNRPGGYIAGSMNAAQDRCIKCIPIMAGQKIYQYAPMLRISLLTPKTPAYQKLKGKLSLFFVPNSRVMKDWENFEAQIKNETSITIEEEPNFGGKVIPRIDFAGTEKKTSITNLKTWRDCWLSSYIPRVGVFGMYGSDYIMPKYSSLPARGFRAIYNDFLRNKEYDRKLQEFDGNEVSDAEWESYLPTTGKMTHAEYTARARRSDNYYTDYRTQYQGLTDETAPDLSNLNNNLVTWASWEAKIAEGRSQAESANDNPWERIAEIRGSQAAYQGKVQKLSEKVFDINYSAITQNAYNTNTEIEEQFQVMGKQGAYSYTEIMMPLLAGWEAVESGHFHILFNVYAETAFENGFERQWLNVNALDKYRPDLKDDKLDVLYEIETDGNAEKDSIIGFKRRYNELFKLPNCIFGDASNNNYYNNKYLGNRPSLPNEEEQIISQKTYTFFEQNRNWYQSITGQEYRKTPWKDYSDIQVNKNQAIINELVQTDDVIGDNDAWDIDIMGQHQIFFVGEDLMHTELPVDAAIAENYTVWGEH